MEATVVLTIFDKVLNILGLVRDGKIFRDDRIDTAINLLYTAISETELYTSKLADGAKHDREHEYKLACLWHDASVPLRHIDKDLARRCFIKGSYWLEPEAWDEAKIKESRIALDEIFEETRKLLLNGE